MMMDDLRLKRLVRFKFLFCRFPWSAGLGILPHQSAMYDVFYVKLYVNTEGNTYLILTLKGWESQGGSRVDGFGGIHVFIFVQISWAWWNMIISAK